MKVFKITLGNNIKYGFFKFLYLASFCIMLTQNDEFWRISFLLVPILPGIIIHVSYLWANMNCKLTIDYQKNEFTFQRGGDAITERFQNVNQAINIEPFFGFLSRDKITYHYKKLVLSSGRTILITCLLMDNVSLPLPNTTTEERYFPVAI